MKKIFSIILFSLFVFLPIVVDAKEDKVMVHVFYAEWCGNCTNLHNFLNELEEDKNYNDMFEIKYYRLDNSSQYGENKKYDENNQLFLKVSSYLGTNGKSIPFLVIGEKYEVGFSKTQSPDTIKELIKNEYFNKEKKNIVQDISDEKINVEINIKDDDDDDQNNQETETNLEKDNKRTTTIIGIGVIIATLIVVVVIVVVSIYRK